MDIDPAQLELLKHVLQPSDEKTIRSILCATEH